MCLSSFTCAPLTVECSSYFLVQEIRLSGLPVCPVRCPCMCRAAGSFESHCALFTMVVMVPLV